MPSQSRTPLISRKTFFDNPDRMCVRLSPDGTKIAYIAPYKEVMNIWVSPRDKPNEAQVITKESTRGIMSFSWAHANDKILYPKDKEGDENWHIHCVDILTHEDKDLTPYGAVSARISKISPHFPTTILISVNDRTPERHDTYKVDILTGRRDLVYENNEFVGFLFDDQYNLRFAMRLLPDGSSRLDRYQDGEFTKFDHVPYEDVLGTSPLDFNKAGNKLYTLDSRGRDTTGLYLVDIATGQKDLLAEHPKADISDTFIHPTTKEFEGWAATYLKKEWVFINKAVKDDITLLQKNARGVIEVLSRDQANQYWILVDLQDAGPSEYYLYDRQSQEKSHLFSSQKSLEGLNLSPMHPVVIKARDGLEMVSYYTLPRECDPKGQGAPRQSVPLVLTVHGGPQARDSWGYNPATQWLANRGYAVLSVNYRGSTGFGKAFTNAGDGEWSKKMHDDLIDAVNWAVDKGITTKDQIAIYGGSYGGYATLVGLTSAPDFFACGVDIVGPSNLKTLMETVPAYWKPILDMLKKRIGGDLESETGLAELAARSPVHKASNIKKPLLIAQGANDPRVKQAESDQFASALKAKGIPVTYVLYPDEGHGFSRPPNKMSFFALTEAFLQEHLGGRAEPIGSDLEGSTYQLLESGPEIAKALNLKVS